MPTPSEIRKEQNKKMTTKQKSKQIFKMIMATLMVASIFILGYAIIFVAGFFLFA